MKLFNAILLIVIVPSVFADYTITHIGGFNEHFDRSRPSGINGNGQVVGWSKNASNNNRAFLWDSVNGIQDIGDLGGGVSMATGINDAGQIVGSSKDSSGEFRPFIWDSVNGMQSFSDISSDSFIGVTINNNAQIAGDFYDSSGWSQAFRWDNSNGTQLLGNLNQNPLYAHESQSAAININNNNQIVGWADDTLNNDRAFLWDNENGMQNLGTLGTTGGNCSSASGINDSGQIVGSSNNKAFLWDETNGMNDLETLGGTITFASDINNNSQIVGTGFNSLTQQRAILWEDDNIIDLSDCLADNSDFVFLTEALRINGNGQIIGLGHLKYGFESMFIMTPVPEPTTLTLFVFGSLLLRNRKQL